MIRFICHILFINIYTITVKKCFYPLKSQLEVFYVLTHDTESGKGSNLLLTAYILLIEQIVVGIELLALKEVSLSVGELIFLTDV